jgi:hypothetical protein
MKQLKRMITFVTMKLLMTESAHDAGAEFVLLGDERFEGLALVVDLLDAVEGGLNADFACFAELLVEGCADVEGGQRFHLPFLVFEFELLFFALRDPETSLDGLRFLSSLTPSTEFEARYAASYPGQVLDVGADSSYDVVMLLAQAMRETGSEDPAAVAAYIRGLETFKGASGELVFDGQGGVTKEFQEFEVVNGVAVLRS